MAATEDWRLEGEDEGESSSDESAVATERLSTLGQAELKKLMEGCGWDNVLDESGSVPAPLSSVLTKEEYSRRYNFQIRIAGSSSGTKWMFSHVMNKLFITLKTVIGVGFKCDFFGPDLFVRAILEYCGGRNSYEPVVRCLSHQSRNHSDNAGIDDALINHVLHINDSGAIYERNDNSGRYSVRMPLSRPQAGTDWVTVGLKFMCKNSCTPGLDRRPTEAIFILENKSGAVLGHRTMKVRICSHPKRAMTKAENWKSDPFFVQVFQGEAALVDVTICEQARIKRRLQAENRQPTKEEAALLIKYKRDLEHGFSPGN